MALQSSGAISMNDINVELTYSGTATISLNDTAVRALAGASFATGAISLYDFYGKAVAIADANFANVVVLLNATEPTSSVIYTITDTADSAAWTKGTNSTYGYVEYSSFSPYSFTSANYPYTLFQQGASFVLGHSYVDNSWPDTTYGDSYLYRTVTLSDMSASDFCIEGWVYLPRYLTYDARIFKIVSSTATITLSIKSAGGSATSQRLEYNNGAGLTVTSSNVAVMDKTWTHFIFAKSGSSLYCYINGTLAFTSATTGIGGISGACTFYISDNSTATKLHAYITDFRLVQGSSVYSMGGTVNPPTAPLTAISGTKLLLNAASKGLVNLVTRPSTAMAYGSQISIVSPTGIGKPTALGPRSISFGNTSDILRYQNLAGNVNDPIATPPTYTSFTAEGWFYRGNSTNTGYTLMAAWPLYGSGSYTGKHQWKLMIDSGYLKFYNDGNNSYFGTAQGGVDTYLPVNTWYHVAVCRDGSTGAFYLFTNGSLVQSFTNSNINAYAVRTDNFDVGGFVGYADEVKYTLGVCRYTTGFTPPAPPGNSPSGTYVAKPGQAVFYPQWNDVTYSDYTFIVPPSVTSISAVAVGAGGNGGGGGGGLAYGTFSVTPGEKLKIRIGSNNQTDSMTLSSPPDNTSIKRADGTNILTANAGNTSTGYTNGYSSWTYYAGAAGGGYSIGSGVTTSGGGTGGSGGSTYSNYVGGINAWVATEAGGGGAAGYGGNGGNGGNGGDSGQSGSAGSQGGGGGGGAGADGTGTNECGSWATQASGGAGGGVSVYGYQGGSGSGGTGASSGSGGGGGGGGTYGTVDSYTSGSYYPGAGMPGGQTDTGEPDPGNDCNSPGSTGEYFYASAYRPQGGAVRLIWGSGRAYPSTNTASV